MSHATTETLIDPCREGAGNGRYARRQSGDERTIETRHARIVYRTYYDSDALQLLLSDPDRFVAQRNGDLIKTDAASTVVAVSFDGRKYVVKRYNSRSLWHACRRALRRTRAERSWLAARRFEQAGIDTPRPVAMVEKRRGPLRGVAYYVTEHVAGQLCSDYFRSPHSEHEHERIAECIAGIFRRLIDNALSHGDMKATNLIVGGDGVCVLDLDAVRSHRWQATQRRAIVRDVRRFLKNWQDQPQLGALFEARLVSVDQRRD